jgi:hypothetical protein
MSRAPALLLAAALAAACADPPPPQVLASAPPPAKVVTPRPPPPPVPEQTHDPQCDIATPYLHALHSAAQAPAPDPGALRTSYTNTGLQRLVQASDAATGRSDDAAVLAALAGTDAAAFVGAEFAVLGALSQWMRHNLKVGAEGKDPGERRAAWSAARCVWEQGLRPLARELQRRSEERSSEAARDDAAIADEIDQAFAAGSAALPADAAAAIDDRRLLPARQVVEKTWYRVLHRKIGDEARAARDGDPLAARRAQGLFALLRDRLQDKNTPGIAVVEAQLAGDPKAVDPAAILKQIDLALVKRARKYCSDAIDAKSLATPAGAASVAEGAAYTRVLLPGMRAALSAQKFDAAAHLATWQAFAEAVDAGDDKDELQKLRDELVHWNCAYQQALGVRECTATADERPAK